MPLTFFFFAYLTFTVGRCILRIQSQLQMPYNKDCTRILSQTWTLRQGNMPVNLEVYQKNERIVNGRAKYSANHEE